MNATVKIDAARVELAQRTAPAGHQADPAWRRAPTRKAGPPHASWLRWPNRRWWSEVGAPPSRISDPSIDGQLLQENMRDVVGSINRPEFLAPSGRMRTVGHQGEVKRQRAGVHWTASFQHLLQDAAD